MPTTLFLLLTILTAPAVPRFHDDGRLGQPAQPSPLGAIECRLRVGRSGVPLVRVDVAPGHSAWFVLDTGATGTTIRAELVERLGLRASGRAHLTTVDGALSTPTVRLAGFRITGVPSSHDVDAAVHALTAVRQAEPEADGILGQDVLAGYDYLLDHARQRITIGRFAAPANGVRVPLTWSAGRPVLQLVVGDASPGLVLDTGSDVLVMEARAARAAFGTPPAGVRSRGMLQTHAGARVVDVEHHTGLRMANVALPPVAVVRVSADAWHMSPEVGLLPASLFSRVYVSARTGEAAVWVK